VSTVVVEPPEAGAVVSLHDTGGIGGMFHRAADGVWIDMDGFEYVWPEIEHLAATGGYQISRVQPVATA